MRIALSGRKFSGKDECAKVLGQRYNSLIFSFSDQLKKIANEHFPWLELDYPQGTKEETVWVSPYDGKKYSPRDIWVKLNCLVEIDPAILVRKLHQERDDYELTNQVIKDLRPHNPCELEYCIRHDFKIIYIENCKDPVSTENLDVTEDDFTDIKKHAVGVFSNYKEGPEPFAEFVHELKEMGVL
jgi:hypothetical protein